MVSAGTAQSMAVLTEEDSASDSGFCGFKPASTVRPENGTTVSVS